MRLGDFLRTKRKEKGLTLYEAAPLLETHPSTISHVELSKVFPGEPLMERLSSLYGLNIDELRALKTKDKEIRRAKIQEIRRSNYSATKNIFDGEDEKESMFEGKDSIELSSLDFLEKIPNCFTKGTLDTAKKILALLKLGKTKEEISKTAGIGIGTVRNLISELIKARRSGRYKTVEAYMRTREFAIHKRKII